MKYSPFLIDTRPGARIAHAGQTWEVIGVIDMRRIAAVNVDSGQECILRFEDLEKYRADQQPTTTDQPLRIPALPDETAVKCISKKIEVINPLIADPNHTRKDVERIAKLHKLHIATVYKWYKCFSDRGRDGLAPRKEGRPLGRNLLKPEQEQIIQEAIDDVYLQNQRPRISVVVEEIQRRCQRDGHKTPHQNTIRKRISLLHPRDRLRKRGFKDQARDRYNPILGHHPGGAFPLAEVQIDHTRLDLIVVDEQHREPLERPWLTLAVDVYSRVVVGIHIGFDEPSSTTAGLCLANAVTRKEEYLKSIGVTGNWPVFGLMHAIHADNGAEFHGDTLREACEHYGINIHWRPIPKKNYGGHIERLMGTIANWVRNLPGATFSNIQQRKGYDSANESALTLKEVERELVHHIVNVYHRQIHSSILMPPIVKWMQGTGGTDKEKGSGIQFLNEDPTHTRLSFLPFFTRTIQRYGVRIDGITYYDPILIPFIGMPDPKHPKIKREFKIRRDPRDIRTIYFLEPVSNTYTPIPTTNRGIPQVSATEWRSAQKRLRTEGRLHYDEQAVIESIEIGKARIREAKTKTKQSRKLLAKSQSRSIVPIQAPTVTPRALKPAILETPTITSDDDGPILPFDGTSLHR